MSISDGRSSQVENLSNFALEEILRSQHMLFELIKAIWKMWTNVGIAGD